MDFALDAATGIFRQGFPYGYLRTGKTTTRKSANTATVYFTPNGTKKLKQVKALDEMTEKVTELSALIDAFEFPEGNDPKQFRSVAVSEKGRVSADAEPGARLKTYTLDINSIAKQKIFKSRVLASNEQTDLSDGTHSFEINKNGTVQSLDVEIDASDTHRDVFVKLANAINAAEEDLEAEVVDSERKVYSSISGNLFEDVSYLKISAKDTGESIDFVLQDDSGTLVNDLNLNRNIQAGSKASYTLNKVSAESDSNTVSADSGRLELELLDETEGTLSIKVENGSEPLKAQIAEIVSAHNDYVGFLDQNEKYVDSSIKNSMLRALKEIEGDIEQIGLNLNNRGTIGVSDSFEKEFEDNTDTVRRLLTGTGGLFSTLSEGLDEVSENDVEDYAADSILDPGSSAFSLYL